MNNKKVILVIILFIGISFIVYSFANPLTEEENLDGNGGKTGISEGNNGGSSTIIKDDDFDKDKDEDKEEKPTEENPDAEDPTDDSQNQQVPQSPTIAQNRPTTNQTKPATPKYYCKVVGGRYYGKNGNVVNYATYDSECIPDVQVPTLTMNTSSYIAMVGTSKSISDFYNSTFGKTGGSVVCRNGNTVVNNLNELPAGVYALSCTATGSNGKTETKTLDVRLKPTSNVSASTINYDSFRTSISDGDGNVITSKGLNLKTIGNEIYVTGQMFTQPLDHDLQSYQYITLDYVGQRQYTAEELGRAKFYINTRQIYPTVNVNVQGKSYISIKRSFMTGDTFKVKIDWGDGNEMYEYTVHYDAEIISIDEALENLSHQTSNE